MSPLLRLMKQLGADAALAEAYERDRTSVIARFELGDEEREALLKGDIDAIHRLTGIKGGLFATNSTIRAYDA